MAAIDLEALQRTREDLGDEIVQDLFERFVESAQDLIIKLQKAFGSGDVAAAGMCAHSLKGSALFLGAEDLAAACDEIERAGAAGDASQSVGRAVESVDLHFQAAKQILAKQLKGS